MNGEARIPARLLVRGLTDRPAGLLAPDGTTRGAANTPRRPGWPVDPRISNTGGNWPGGVSPGLVGEVVEGWRVLRVGLDTVAAHTSPVGWGPVQRDQLRAWAIRAQRQAQDAEEAFVVELEGRRLVVEPAGTRFYTLRLTCPDFSLEVGPRVRSEAQPVVIARLGAVGLAARGLAGLWAEISAVAGRVCADALQLVALPQLEPWVLTRADVALDVEGAPAEVMEGCEVSTRLAREVAIRDRPGGPVESWRWGAASSAVQVVLYDKLAEFGPRPRLSTKAHLLDEWAAAGWSGRVTRDGVEGPRVARLEVRMMRDHLAACSGEVRGGVAAPLTIEAVVDSGGEALARAFRRVVEAPDQARAGAVFRLVREGRSRVRRAATASVWQAVQAVAAAMTADLVERQATVADDLAVVGARAVRRAYAAWGRAVGARAAAVDLRALAAAWRGQAVTATAVAEALERQAHVGLDIERRAVEQFRQALSVIAVAGGRGGEQALAWPGLVDFLEPWPAEWEAFEQGRARARDRLLVLLPDAPDRWGRLLTLT